MARARPSARFGLRISTLRKTHEAASQRMRSAGGSSSGMTSSSRLVSRRPSPSADCGALPLPLAGSTPPEPSSCTGASETLSSTRLNTAVSSSRE